MAKLILLRHGASLWNELNLFTGWVDIPLSQKGVQEALSAGRLLADTPIDAIFTSTLMRSLQTAMLVMSEHRSGKVPVLAHKEEGMFKNWSSIYSTKILPDCIPITQSWQLNERMYGKLQGMNKQEARDLFGEELVHIWRRSYNVPPPDGESLEMTAKRSIPYFKEKIVPLLESGSNLLIAAHGNSLRSIVMDLENLTAEEIISVEIPTGIPAIYSYEQGVFKKHAN
jgi:2,3-bisphosphoglycerate-dependent phosphoglycerate mutase